MAKAAHTERAHRPGHGRDIQPGWETAGYDKTVKLWDAATGQELLTLKGHRSFVTSVAFSSDGKRLVSASNDDTIKLWDAATGQELLTLKGHTDSAMSVAFSPDGKRLASAANSDKRIKI